MKLFQDKFSIYKKAGEPLYKTPKSVQECIELLKIAPDGIFEVACNRYSRSYLFSDVNQCQLDNLPGHTLQGGSNHKF